MNFFLYSMSYENDYVEICMKKKLYEPDIILYNEMYLPINCYIYIRWKKTNTIDIYEGDSVFEKRANDNISIIYRIPSKIYNKNIVFVDSKTDMYIHSFYGQKLNKCIISDDLINIIEKNIKKQMNERKKNNMIYRYY